MAELEKLGQKYRIALRIARDERWERLKCDHKGVYADDCLGIFTPFPSLAQLPPTNHSLGVNRISKFIKRTKILVLYQDQLLTRAPIGSRPRNETQSLHRCNERSGSKAENTKDPRCANHVSTLFSSFPFHLFIHIGLFQLLTTYQERREREIRH